MTPANLVPDIEAIRAAAARIAPFIHRTPVLTCRTLDEMSGARLFFKCENLQKAGAFKIRGAVNAVFSLDADTLRAGVATHSSGNHGAALALAAALRGVPACVVVPKDAASPKLAAIAGYGAKVVLCPPTAAGREAGLARVVAETGACMVHPFDDERVIAGQGTAALELCADVPDLDVVITPVGGGGLLSGTAIAVRAVSPGTQIMGAEPAGADDAARSLRAGKIVANTVVHTLADGLRATRLGNLTFPLIRAHVSDIVTVSDTEIVAAMRLIWARMKLVVEPSAAVPLAAVLSGRMDVAGKQIGILLSGGNVDLDCLPWRQDGRPDCGGLP